MVTYLVSGAEDIHPTHDNLRRSGRVVRHGGQVTRAAPEELRQGMRYVVVAHGDEAGTIFWANEPTEVGSPWLWVGMSPTPVRARVYLYCCNAGPRLSRYLRDCECFGHCSPVPAPVDEARDIVLAYLRQVEGLMHEEDFSVAHWRERLSTYVGEQLDLELDEPSCLLGPSFWLALSKSLNARADSVV